MTKYTREQIAEILRLHRLWLNGDEGGKHANLYGANLYGANLYDADFRGADFQEADLQEADLQGANLYGADLYDADLRGAKLYGANLYDAYLRGADLRGADLRGADLRGADLLCFGNMREIRTMQIDTWVIGYTADTLQIGCQRHTIDKWRKWDTDAGRKWISAMDTKALDWADRNLALVLAVIDANPATPTGHEVQA
jgi:hypothetical protein